MNDSMPRAQAMPAKNEIDLLDLLLVVAENVRLLVIGPLLVGLLALGLSFLVTPTFTAVTRILPPQQQQGAAMLLAQQLGSLAGLAGAAAGIKNPADIYVAMLQSTTVADRLVDRFKLVDLYESDFREDARKELADRTRVHAGKDGIITVEVDDHDPKRAAEIARAYVRELQDLNSTLAITEAAQRRAFFERQLEQAKENLKGAELALQGSGVGESTLKADPQAAVEGIARLRAEITAAEVRLASMRSYLTNNSPEVRQTEHGLVALRQQLAKLERSSGTVDEKGAEYISRYRDYKYHETLFELMAKQFEMAKLDEAREGTLVQVVDPAQPPERKSRPKKALIAIITTIASFLALFVFVCIKKAYQRVTDQPDGSARISAIRRALRGDRR